MTLAPTRFGADHEAALESPDVGSELGDSRCVLFFVRLRHPRNRAHGIVVNQIRKDRTRNDQDTFEFTQMFSF